MRVRAALLVLFALPSPAFAQTREAQDALESRLATLRYVTAMQAANGGFAPAAGDPRPAATLRATSAAVQAVKHLGGTVPNPERVAAFVTSCFDPKSGGFADTPGGAVDAATTAVGVMAAVETGVPRETFARAMTYLVVNAKTWEEVRIGAAAVGAWGVKACPFKLDPWFALADAERGRKPADAKDGGARAVASWAAMVLRLGRDIQGEADVRAYLHAGQRADGAFGKAGEKGSDLETTYRVTRAFYLMRVPPKDAAALRAFVGKCRNADGGYGVAPGTPSTAAGTYYAARVAEWLAALDGIKR